MKKSILATAVLSSLISLPTLANQAGDILFRAGSTFVQPANNDATVYAADMTVHVGGPATTVSVEDNTQLGLNLAYFVTDNWAVELLAATPFNHEISIDVGPASVQLAETKHLPPVLSAVYFFNDLHEKFKPYVGLGINYTVFFEDKFTSTMQGDDVQVTALNNTSILELNDTLGLPAGTESVGLQAKELNLENSWGISAQVGFDYHVNENWYVNASVRYIDIDTTATFKATALEVPGKVDVEIDPMVYTLSFGYNF